MSIWEDSTFYTQFHLRGVKEPDSWTCRLGPIRVVVYRYHNYPPDCWMARVFGRGGTLMATDLGPMPLRDAQGEALRLWCDRLDQWRLSAHNALTHFEKEEDKS